MVIVSTYIFYWGNKRWKNVEVDFEWYIFTKLQSKNKTWKLKSIGIKLESSWNQFGIWCWDENKVVIFENRATENVFFNNVHYFNLNIFTKMTKRIKWES